MGYCKIHGTFADESLFSDIRSGCPECRQAEKEAEQFREEQRESIEQQQRDRENAYEREAEAWERSQYKQANPGDYKCPFCLYITLKQNASRCPKCHAAISTLHWTQVSEFERRKIEMGRTAERERAEASARQAAEWDRKAPERAEVAARDRMRKILKTATTGIVACFTCAIVFALCSWITSNDYFPKYDKIEIGMTENDVAQLLRPIYIYKSQINDHRVQWNFSEPDSVTWNDFYVLFQDGRVIVKMSRGYFRQTFYDGKKQNPTATH